MIKVKRIRHVTFVTPDIERQIDYYQTVVGLGVAGRHARIARGQGERPAGGAITAACFLSKFAKKLSFRFCRLSRRPGNNEVSVRHSREPNMSGSLPQLSEKRGDLGSIINGLSRSPWPCPPESRPNFYRTEARLRQFRADIHILQRSGLPRQPQGASQRRMPAFALNRKANSCGGLLGGRRRHRNGGSLLSLLNFPEVVDCFDVSICPNFHQSIEES